MKFFDKSFHKEFKKIMIVQTNLNYRLFQIGKISFIISGLLIFFTLKGKIVAKVAKNF